jgi:uncharacterized protein (TIRG00374 family)
MKMHARAKLVVKVLLSLAVSCAFIVFSLRHANLKVVLAAMGAVDPWPVLGYLVALLIIHVVKTARWWLLLKPLGPTSFWRVNSVSAVGFMWMVVLPLRLGELARPLLISRPSKRGEASLSRSGALATCVVERVVDTLAVGVLGIVSLHVLATTGSAADLARRAAAVVTVGFGALCIALVFAFLMRERAVTTVRWTLRPLSPRVADRAASFLDAFIRGLHLGSGRRVLAFLGLTVVYWSLHVWGFWAVAAAFGLKLTALMACTVLACQVVGIMIPAGPGMVGTSQFFTQLGLSIFIPGALSVPDVAARAVAYANTIWLLQFGQQVLLGLVFVAAGRETLTGLVAPPQDGLPLADELPSETRA